MLHTDIHGLGSRRKVAMFGGQVIGNSYLEEAVPNHSDKVCDHANDDHIDVTNHVSDWTTEHKEGERSHHT